MGIAKVSHTGVSAAFRDAVAGLSGAGLRREATVGSLPSPTQLAPHTDAVSVTIATASNEEAASGRLVLLHDPAGVDAWEGTFRIVVFGTSEIETPMAVDTLLPEVAWSWLTEHLASTDADFLALGGTVTITSSSRFGDIAGPARINELELRASWTAADSDTAPHLAAFAGFLAMAAGLPPEGVAAL